MSCTIGNTCAVDADCGIANNSSTCLGVLCNTSGKCQSTACTGDCSAFGDGYSCVNGQCTPTGCSSTVPCPANMTCIQGNCTSISCETSGCPSGMICKKLADGSKVCVSNPGMKGIIRLLVVLILILIVISIILYLLYRKTGVSPLSLFKKK